MSGAALLSCVLVFGASADPDAGVVDPSVVDRVVAVVERVPVLMSDVELTGSLSAADPSPAPFWTRDAPAVQLTVDAVLVRLAAGDLALYQPTRDAVADGAATLRANLGGAPSRWGLDDEALLVEVRRRLVVERFLARNVRADPADPTAWGAECEALLSELRRRVKVRVID